MKRTAFITGASRGIGKEIGLKLASQGYNIVIAAKTIEPHSKLEGTIYSAAEEMEKLGARVLAVQCDIRFEESVINAVNEGADAFGGIDILVNNASAISLTTAEHTDMKKYDLMHNINVRGTFLVSKTCVAHLKKGNNPHILTLSPPLNMQPLWFGRHLAYTMSKYGMSMTVVGLAEELKDYGIGVNALWPRTTIATAAVKNLLGGDTMIQQSRTPEIVADAAAIILNRDAKLCTGNFFIDDEVLRSEGIEDLKKYAVNPANQLMKDLFI